MKFLLLFLGFGAVTPSWAQETFTPPVPYETARYEMLWKKSPFTLASTEEIVTAGFADNLILMGVARIGDQAIATVMDRSTSQRQTVTMNPNAQGLRLISVGDMSSPLKASVRVQLGSETAEIRFDPMLVQSGPAPGVPQVPVVPGQPPRPGQPVPAIQIPNTPQRANPASGTIVPPPPARTGGRRRVIIPNQPPN